MSRCAGLRSGLACKDSEGLFTGNETTQKSAECFSKGGKVREEIGTFNPKKTPHNSLFTQEGSVSLFTRDRTPVKPSAQGNTQLTARSCREHSL